MGGWAVESQVKHRGMQIPWYAAPSHCQGMGVHAEVRNSWSGQPRASCGSYPRVDTTMYWPLVVQEFTVQRAHRASFWLTTTALSGRDGTRHATVQKPAPALPPRCQSRHILAC